MYAIITYKRDKGESFCVWNRGAKIIRKYYIVALYIIPLITS